MPYCFGSPNSARTDWLSYQWIESCLSPSFSLWGEAISRVPLAAREGARATPRKKRTISERTEITEHAGILPIHRGKIRRVLGWTGQILPIPTADSTPPPLAHHRVQVWRKRPPAQRHGGCRYPGRGPGMVTGRPSTWASHEVRRNRERGGLLPLTPVGRTRRICSPVRRASA